MHLTNTRGLYNEIRTVTIVPKEGESRDFILYRKLVTHFSTFFNNIFGEGTTVTHFKLGDTDPKTFELFQQWINAGRFEYRWKQWVPRPDDPYMPLVELYELAEKMGSIALMNQVITSIRKIFEDSGKRLFMSVPIVNYIYTNTNKGAPLRNITRDMFAFNADMTTLTYKKSESIHSEFDAELRKRLIQRTRDPTLLEPNHWVYHLHEVPSDEDECTILERESAANRQNAERVQS